MIYSYYSLSYSSTIFLLLFIRQPSMPFELLNLIIQTIYHIDLYLSLAHALSYRSFLMYSIHTHIKFEVKFVSVFPLHKLYLQLYFLVPTFCLAFFFLACVNQLKCDSSAKRSASQFKTFSQFKSLHNQVPKRKRQKKANAKKIGLHSTKKQRPLNTIKFSAFSYAPSICLPLSGSLAPP